MNFNVSTLEKIRWKIASVQNTLRNFRLQSNEHVIIDTEFGQVKGVKRNNVYGDTYYSFEGIPYARPPVGELRFKAPQKPEKWEGIRDCTLPPAKSVQLNFITGKVTGSEDCLYLNVYTNNLKPEEPYPVLMFIHGGGFIFGEANRDWYGPDYFIRQNIMLVVIQYRLGVLGFLSLSDKECNVPGNNGLKDQIMALQWIQNNCQSFGGNAHNVTVCGESAGGASVDYLLLNERVKGMFHRAIPMSGNSFCPWAITHCQHRAYRLAQLAGYKGEANDASVLAYLSKVKAYQLIQLEGDVLTEEEHRQKVMFAFGPTIEPYITTDCAMPKAPRDLLPKAWGNSIPLMMGFTSFEGLFMLSVVKKQPNVVNELETCASFVPQDLLRKANLDETKALELGAIIKKAHVSGDKPTANDFMDICSLYYFLFPAHRELQLRLQNSSAPVYWYRFDFDSENLINPYRIMRYGRNVKGVSHADELSYLFWNILAKRMSKNSPEYELIEKMISIWTQFAKTGRPFEESAGDNNQIQWEHIKKGDHTYKCLNIGKELQVIPLPENEKLLQWESLYTNHKKLF